MSKPLITLCMIVKDEEDVIKRCLDSVYKIIDEIVIVDTGSTDNTKNICYDYTKNLFDFEWTGSFSEARNFSLSKATGKWVLVLDADEYVERENLSMVLENLKNSEHENDSFAVTIYNFTGANAQQVVQHKNLRIFKNDSQIRYKRDVHEQLFRADDDLTSKKSDLILYHSGYLRNTVIGKNKHSRNTELLEKELKKTNNAFDYFNFGNEYMSKEEFHEAIRMYRIAYQYKESIGLSWVSLCVVHLVECLLHVEEYQDAIKVIKDAELIWGSSPELQTLKGIIYFKQFRFEDAKEVLNNLSKNKENYQDFIKSIDYLEYYPNEILGGIYEAEFSIESAVKHYTEAYSFNKNQKVFKNLISLLATYVTEKQFLSFIYDNGFINMEKELKSIIEILISKHYTSLLECILVKYPEKIQNCEALQLKLKFMNNKVDEVINTLVQNPKVIVNQSYFDIIDLNIIALYVNDSKQLNTVKALMQSNMFVYEFINNPSNYINENNKKELKNILINILIRCLDLHQIAIFKKLLPLKEYFDKMINVEIGNVLYSNSYYTLAIDFYQECETKEDYDSQAFVNLIQEFKYKKHDQDALNFVIQSLELGHIDFRLYSLGIELIESKGFIREKQDLIKVAMEHYIDSQWLENQYLKSELSDIFL